MSSFSVHFDGPITVNHKVSLRVLSRTYEHMQRAIDRAYLVEKFGEVWKHARLSKEDYEEVEFIAEYPQEGGIILDAIKKGKGAVIDRIASSVRPIFEKSLERGLAQNASIAQQLAERKNYVEQMGENTPSFKSVAEDPPGFWAPGYSSRSVVKEIDQIVSQISPARVGGSTVEILLKGDRVHLPFVFDARVAGNFHAISSHKELAAAMIVNVTVRSLDRGNKQTKPSAKVLNMQTGRELVLYLHTNEAFEEIRPYHNGVNVRIYASPIVEALGFDIHSGDLMFLGVVQ